MRFNLGKTALHLLVFTDTTHRGYSEHRGEFHAFIRHGLGVFKVKVCSSIGTCIGTGFLPTWQHIVHHESLPIFPTKLQLY